MCNWVIYLLAVGLLAACGGRTNDNSLDLRSHQIRNGTDLSTAQFPLVGFVQLKNGSICTGTLIASDLVLTAAHCVVYQRVNGSIQLAVPSNVEFSLDTMISSLSNRKTASAVYIHPEYLDLQFGARMSPPVNGGADIALIRLKESYPPAASYYPLFSSKDRLVSGALVEAVGYGLSSDAADSAGRKRYGTFAFNRYLDSVSLLGITLKNSLLEVRPSDENQITCSGDSGGPLFVMKDGVSYLAGISHAGPTGCSSRSYAFHTAIGPFLDWIESVKSQGSASDSLILSDDFIAGDWIENLGGFLVENNAAVSQSAGRSISTVENFLQSDAYIRADVQVKAGADAMLVARYSGPGENSFYSAILHYDSQLKKSELGIWKCVNGAYTLLGKFGVASSSGRLVLLVISNEIHVALDDEARYVRDSNPLSGGSVGIGAFGSVAVFRQIDAGTVYLENNYFRLNKLMAEGFEYTQANGLGTWRQNKGAFRTSTAGFSSSQTADRNIATLNGFSEKNVSIVADMELKPATSHGMLIARYAGPEEQNFYSAIWYPINGAYAIALFKNIGGGYTQIGLTKSVTAMRGKLRLDVNGERLQVYLDNQLLIDENDSSIPNAGSAGFGAFNAGTLIHTITVRKLSAMGVQPSPTPTPVTTTVKVDDGDSNFSLGGTGWQIAASYGASNDIRYKAPGNGTATATWKFTGLIPGVYRISVTYHASATFRASNAPYTVYDGGTKLGVVRVNQRVEPSDLSDSGSNWKDLARAVNITSGSITVTLSDDADNYVIADSVRIERVGEPDVSKSFPIPPAIVDDGDSGFTTEGGIWTAYNGAGALNDIQYVAAGSGAVKSKWQFTGLTPGVYRISATYVSYSNRASNAPYTVYDGGTKLGVVRVNQRVEPSDLSDSGSNWKDLARAVNIASGSIAVTLSDDADGYVIADSVRIERVGEPDVSKSFPIPPAIVDDGDSGFTTEGGIWTAYNGAGGLNDIRYVAAGNGAVKSKWQFTGLTPGVYRISATYVSYSNRASNAPYTVYDGGTKLGVVRVNQRVEPSDLSDSGSNWKDLARAVNITSGSIAVTLSDDADGYVIADSVRIERVGEPDVSKAFPIPPTIVDDGDSGFTTEGGIWTAYNGSGALNDIQYVAAGSGAVKSKWQFTGLTPGVYRISATYVSYSNRASNAPYTVYDGGTKLGVVRVNQRVEPSDLSDSGSNWKDLARAVNIASGSIAVTLSDDADGYVIADSVRIERVGEPDVSKSFPAAR